MKKPLLIAILFFATLLTFAQQPLTKNYTYEVRSTSNSTAAANTNVSITLTVKNVANNATVYTETHTVTTNALGQVTLTLGGGTAGTPTWSGITWSTHNGYQLVATVGTSGYSVVGGTSSLLIVNNPTDYTFVNPNGKLSQLSPVGVTGNYSDLTNRPDNLSDFTNDAGFLTSDSTVITDLQDASHTHDNAGVLAGITAADTTRWGQGQPQVQADWNQTTTTAADFIKNKPTALSDFTNDAGFLTSDSTVITDLQDASHTHDNAGVLAGITAADTTRWGQGQPQVQADWNQTTTTAADFIKNKPTIPDAQVQADWNQTTTTAADFIKNKPTIPSTVAELSDANNYAQLAEDNTFTGDNDFTAGTTTVASGFTLGTTNSTNCGNVAVNACDLLAVFDSIQRQFSRMQAEIDALHDTINQLREANVPVFLYMATTPGVTTMDVVPTFNDEGFSIDEYEFCISTSSDMTGKTCHTTTTAHYVFTGLDPETEYFITVTATNMVGAATSTVVSDNTLSCTSSSEHDIDILSTQLPYVFHATPDTTFAVGTVSGTYTVHRTNAAGCDSSIILHVTVCTPTSSTHNETITTDDLPYTFGDTTFLAGTTSGTFVMHRTNAAGCDSTITLTLTVNTPSSFNCGTETVQDADENEYATVQIGSQCWMKNNLRTTKYADGTAITQSSTHTSTEAHYDYLNAGVYAATDKARRGLLYNWTALMGDGSSSSNNPSGVQGICPTGWHVPSDAEWTQLTDYVSSQSEYVCGSNPENIAQAMVSHDYSDDFAWSNVDCAPGKITSNTNSTGFSAIATAQASNNITMRTYCNTGWAHEVRYWTATEKSGDIDSASYRGFHHQDPTVRNLYGHKSHYYAVRCVKDANSPTPPPTPECEPTSSTPSVSITTADLPYDYADTTFEVGTVSGTYVMHTTNAGGCDSTITLTLTVSEPTPVTHPCAGILTVNDVDGYTYHTVEIGNQCWMKENLRTLTFPDGTTTIPHGGNQNSTTDPKVYSCYNMTDFTSAPAEFQINIRGLWYNWAAVMNGAESSSANPSGVQGICPDGWHIPSDAEWTELTSYVSSQSEFQCDNTPDYIAKAMTGAQSNNGWTSSSNQCGAGNSTGRDATGFSAMCSGKFMGSDDGSWTNPMYDQSRNNAWYWSATAVGDSVYHRQFNYDSPTVLKGKTHKKISMAVRCLLNPGTAHLGISVPAADSAVIELCDVSSKSVTYTAELLGATADSYTWSCSGGTATPSTTNTYTVTYSAAGDYTVTCSAGGETATFTNTVTDDTYFTVCESCEDGHVYIKSEGNCTSFSWKNSSDVEVSTSNSEISTPTLPAGNYTVTGIRGGCSLTKNVVLSNGAPTTFCNVSSVAGNEVVNPNNASQIQGVKDHQNNVYTVVEINGKCWLKENLRTTQSPSTHTNILTSTAISLSTLTYSGKQARWYNNDETTYGKYGVLYNWNAAVDTFNTTYGETSVNIDTATAIRYNFGTVTRQGICPQGWHLPAKQEVFDMTHYLGISDNAGQTGVSKLVTGCDWMTNSPELIEETSPVLYEYPYRNSTGFSAIPGGCWHHNFYAVGQSVMFWVTDFEFAKRDVDGNPAACAYSWNIASVQGHIGSGAGYTYNGHSVRCLRNDEPVIPTSLNITVPQADSSAVGLCDETSHSVTYTAHLTGATADSYTWSCSGGTATPSTSNTYTVTYNAAGDYTVTCTAAGATATFSNTITAAPTFTICESCDEGIVYIKDQGNCTSFSWKNSSDVEVSTSNSRLSVAAATPVGTYTVTGSYNGCPLTKTVTLSNSAPATYCTVTTKNSNEDWKDGDESSSKIKTVYDHQNNPYKVVQIGNQCWLKENMRATTSPSTGTNIVRSDNPQDYRSYSGKQARWYNNNESQNSKYGLLYNWNAAMDTCNVTLGETSVSLNASDGVTNITTPRRGICPAGWHLPSVDEVNTMRNEVGVSNASSAHEGATGKLVTGCDWGRRTYDLPGLTAPVDFEYEYRNESGLSLLPAGHSTDRYADIGWYAYLWTSTYDETSPVDKLQVNQWNVYGAHNYIHISASSTTLASYCSSVRCVRD